MTKTATTAREVRDLMRSIGDRGRDARLIVSEINVEERIGVPLLSASMRHSSITLYADALADEMTRTFTIITNGRSVLVAADLAFDTYALANADLSLIQAHTITWIAAVTAPDAE